MVTWYRDAYQSQIRADRYCGISTEEKPTKNVENGSWFTEMDTGKNIDLMQRIKNGIFGLETSRWW